LLEHCKLQEYWCSGAYSKKTRPKGKDRPYGIILRRRLNHLQGEKRL
jgi:hypothetical protein